MDLFYIGKGKKNRCLQHFRNAKAHCPDNPAKVRRLLEIAAAGLVPVILTFAVDLTDSEAIRAERMWIARVGRENLTNAISGQFTKAEQVSMWARRELLSQRWAEECVAVGARYTLALRAVVRGAPFWAEMNAYVAWLSAYYAW